MGAPCRLSAQSASEDALDADDLTIDAVGNSLVLEGSASGAVDLDPEVAKVAVGLLLGAGLDVVASREREDLTKTRGLLADDGDVPLFPVSSGLSSPVMATYLDQIKRQVGLGTKTVKVAPASRVARKAEAPSEMLGHLEHEDDIVLHGHGEARAVHGRVDEAVQELLVQVARGILAVAHGIPQTADEAGHSLEDGVALANGDALRAAPGQLLQGGDDALERTLRALLGEGGLFSLSVSLSAGGVCASLTR